MPILTILGLIFSALKIAMELSAWLKDHPQVGEEIRQRISHLDMKLEAASDTLTDIRDLHKDIEAP